FITIVTSLLIAYVLNTNLNGPDCQSCRMSYMIPAYAKLNAFDSSHTRFASKYSLYLYREQYKDTNPNDNTLFLNGIPVLFIPGNAGSYKQARALAAEAATQYYTTKKDLLNLNKNIQNLDFFTADFNEDFTAFHGRTLLDQAEYLNDAIKFILSLYNHPHNYKQSVIIVAHSMGGIVARAMLSLPNYKKKSINTIITLATPHSIPPATFDGDIIKVYSAVDKFWRYNFLNLSKTHSKNIYDNPLKNVSLISITGGRSDTTLPADYTSLASLVPKSNGFTVFTTGIPGVWTPIDHLAIVWCDQLRKVLSKTLFQLINSNSPTGTYGLNKRMEIFKRNLLSGFDSYTYPDSLNFTHKLKINNDQITWVLNDSPKTIPINNLESKKSENKITPDFTVFNIPNDEKYEFTILSSLPFEQIKKFKSSTKSSVLICKNSTDTEKNSNLPLKLIDYSKPYNNHKNQNLQIQLNCIDVSHHYQIIPKSTNKIKSPLESSIGDKELPFNIIQLYYKTLTCFDYILVSQPIIPKKSHNDNDFLLANLVKSTFSNIQINSNFLNILFKGVTVKLSNTRSISVNINFKDIWDSIFAYKMTVKQYPLDLKKFTIKNDQNFAMVFRQWIQQNYESKWLFDFNNNQKQHISFHSIAPFIPFKLPVGSKENSLNFQVLSDSISNNDTIEINLKLDLLQSLRSFALRFRLALASFPLAIVYMVLTIQFHHYSNTGTFPKFDNSLMKLCEVNKILPTFLVLLVFTPIMSNFSIQRVLRYFDFVGYLSNIDDINLIEDDIHVNNYFLGLENGLNLLLGPFFHILSIGIVYLFYHVLFLIIQFLVLIRKTIGFGKNVEKFRNDKTSGKIINSKRRLIGNVVLLILIGFYVPFQFAFIICCGVQFVTCFKMMENIKKMILNRLNYNISFLMLILWTLPINITIIIVFIHNFAVNWRTGFSSHHNFVSIIAILLLVERNSNKVMINQNKSKIMKDVTNLILVLSVIYSGIYGMRNSWWLHHLFNINC
ncbi:Bst1p, partial [Ascoidea rubescens DSM 1968]